MSKPHYVSIREFLNLTRLKEQELCAMLSAGELSGVFLEDGSLHIDISSLDEETLANRSMTLRDSGPTLTRLEEEELASEVLEFLDHAIDEALALAKTWHQKSTPQQSD